MGDIDTPSRESRQVDMPPQNVNCSGVLGLRGRQDVPLRSTHSRWGGLGMRMDPGSDRSREGSRENKGDSGQFHSVQFSLGQELKEGSAKASQRWRHLKYKAFQLYNLRGSTLLPSLSFFMDKMWTITSDL